MKTFHARNDAFSCDRQRTLVDLISSAISNISHVHHCSTHFSRYSSDIETAVVPLSQHIFFAARISIMRTVSGAFNIRTRYCTWFGSLLLTQPNFAVFFDIDGVITKGPNFIPVAKPALYLLHQLKVPIVFLSNTCTFEAEKAKKLSAVLGIPVKSFSPSSSSYPGASNLDQTRACGTGSNTDAHTGRLSQQTRLNIWARSCWGNWSSVRWRFEWRCLSVKYWSELLSHRLGFQSTTTVEKVCQAFPELDMVDHTHRSQLVNNTREFGSVCLQMSLSSGWNGSNTRSCTRREFSSRGR